MTRIRRRQGDRQRGSTYTMMVLVFSILILATASLWVEATQQTFDYTALQTRQTAVSEGAFAGVEWASRAGLGGEKGSGTLNLADATVEVAFERKGPQLVVTSTATGQEQRATVEATLRRVGDAYKLDSYVMRRGDK